MRLERNRSESNKRELPGKYIAKILYKWNNEKFEKEYLKNWKEIGEGRRETKFLL